MKISDLRKLYHSRLCKDVLRINQSGEKEYPNFADASSRASIAISKNIIKNFGHGVEVGKENEQTVGDLFEEITKDFIEESFRTLSHIRPGEWSFSTKGTAISNFEQYEHLAIISEKIEGDKDLTSALGRDYIVKPDIIVARLAVEEDRLNENEIIVDKDGSIARLSPLRRSNLLNPETRLLHACISCKWIIRSDRSQNTRTEALNLINRKGNLPHIAAVTAEPLPTRIAALALGTGDLDCVYHFALYELQQALVDLQNEDQLDMLNILVKGKRLRDISDLPLDLAI